MCLDESYVEAGSAQPARDDLTSGPGTENDSVELAPHVSILAHGPSSVERFVRTER